jgi:hypothetical protein
MACVALIFQDDQGNEQLRTCYCVPGSGNVLKQDGDSVPADQIQVGDSVQICGGSFRAVDAVEVS